MKLSTTISLLGLCLFCLVDVDYAKPWRGIVPLHSSRADVKRLLGKPLFDGNTRYNIYDSDEGRVNFRYVPERCDGGSGNWNVAPDTVSEIDIYLKHHFPVADLKISDFEQNRSEPDHTGATYYWDRENGIAYSVDRDGFVLAITYGPTEKDSDLRCKSSN
jgi:hypothetical protein